MSVSGKHLRQEECCCGGRIPLGPQAACPTHRALAPQDATWPGGRAAPSSTLPPEASSTLCSKNGGGEEEGGRNIHTVNREHHSSHYGRSPWIKKESGNGGGRRAHLYVSKGASGAERAGLWSPSCCARPWDPDQAASSAWASVSSPGR